MLNLQVWLPWGTWRSANFFNKDKQDLVISIWSSQTKFEGKNVLQNLYSSLLQSQWLVQAADLPDLFPGCTTSAKFSASKILPFDVSFLFCVRPTVSASPALYPIFSAGRQVADQAISANFSAIFSEVAGIAA